MRPKKKSFTKWPLESRPIGACRSILSVKDYPEAWANAILPVAREAHERLSFEKVHAEIQEGGAVAAGFAKEKSMPDHISYRDWSTRVVRDELHTRRDGNWRTCSRKSFSSSNKEAGFVSASPSSEASTPAPIPTRARTLRPFRQA